MSLNVPNQLTIARLVLSMVCFVFLSFNWYLTGLVLFVIAAGTDWVDGYWARKYGQITKLGRVMDPFADKIIICGTFIFLAAVPHVRNSSLPASGIAPWMAVLVVPRNAGDSLTQLFRGRRRRFLRQVGRQMENAVSMPGRRFQPVSLGQLFRPALSGRLVGGAAQLAHLFARRAGLDAIALTVYSGWEYVRAALRMLRK